VRLLTHVQAAELLFAAGVVPPHPADAVDRIIEQLKALGGDLSHLAEGVAAEYGEHWEIAAAHMAACLAAFQGDVEVPDWPDRSAYERLYTGMGGE
jgi:hypothetical protein